MKSFIGNLKALQVRNSCRANLSLSSGPLVLRHGGRCARGRSSQQSFSSKQPRGLEEYAGGRATLPTRFALKHDTSIHFIRFFL